jgi:prephenate dehydrogenase
MRIAFLGFGLIAGSIARAVRANPATGEWRLRAWSPTGDGPGRAAGEGILDRAAESPEAAIADADLVVLAAPATGCLELMDSLAGRWRDGLAPDAIVTDVASTKTALLARADALGLRYVGGHPMAGLETAGFDASTTYLFVGRPWVVVPGAGARAGDAGRVADLADACGATVVVMDAAEHDRAVAAVSHLPLVVAAALVEAVVGSPGRERADWPVAAELAAGGWASSTRVARGDIAMGAAIASTNAVPLAARLRDLRAVLDEWLAELERPDGPDEAAIAGRLEAARAALEDER